MAAMWKVDRSRYCPELADSELERQVTVEHSGHWDDATMVNRLIGTALQNSRTLRSI
jgi:hypothetical protein